LLTLDLAGIKPVARRTQAPAGSRAAADMKQVYRKALAGLPHRAPLASSTARLEGEGGGTAVARSRVTTSCIRCSGPGCDFKLKHGAVVIAATRPAPTPPTGVLVGAGLLARKARAKGWRPSRG